ncbi:MAG: AMP-binding protein [Deltaproteobacteria bacterium]|nr:AMP-binding protein [Deltaproteobacteria bacterium]
MLNLPNDRWTLVELVRRQAERLGEREFMRFEDGTVVSFAALERESSRLAHALADLGLRPGDRLLALLLNGPAFLPLLIAANRVGAVFVAVNTELKGAFLEHQLRNSAPRIIAVDRELAKAFSGIDLSGVEAAIVVGRGEHPVDALRGPRLVDLEDLRPSSTTPPALASPSPRDISTVIYTSGTTGPSKGVLVPHAHAYLMGYGLARRLEIVEDDVYYVCMPMFHSNALFMQTVGSLIAGARVAIVRRFSPSRWLDDVRRCGATLTNGLGVMPEFIFRQPPTANDRDHRLRAMMAVPIAAEWGRAFEQRFGVPLVQGYGMTEVNIVAYTDPDDPLEPGCAGRVLDDFFELRIVDADDRPLGHGQVGEIVVRPKEPWCFMAGYQRMPDRTVEAWQNLWFHTGDAGRFDEQGRLFFVDRIKDCIRRRGENISSFEIEQVIGAHPQVAESAVVAVKATDLGGEDEVKAYVVPRAGEEVTPEALLDYCQDRMPRFAVPRFVEFVPALPKTATGKLQKEELRRRGKTPATWDREAVGYVVRR